MSSDGEEARATSETGAAPAGSCGPAFVTTHWSVVQRAGRCDTPQAQTALEQLCRSYWHPLYHYVRRSGYPVEDARDLTQGFFARLLARGALAKADAARGKFRSFLLASLKNFLSDELDKARAQKRGGGHVHGFELPSDDEEQRLIPELADPMTPEQAFERRWAVALLERVYLRLAEEFRQQDKTHHFAALRVALTGERGAVPYADIARRIGLSEGAVKVAVHRLRRRYRMLLRECIAETVSNPEEVEEELRDLLRVLSA